MTVAELIEKLKELPQDLPVGYFKDEGLLRIKCVHKRSFDEEDYVTISG